MRNLKVWRVRYLLDNEFEYIGDMMKKSDAIRKFYELVKIYENVPGAVCRVSLQKRDPKRAGSYKTIKSALIW
ncbi:hypothetical protein [uncultured Dubosiella sp.]|uniref:hypothetical protein n=1 Tax=uncultured Dubosiella sp. TaxID=1937011 RepID=UPI00272DFA41|nr:hypothetical protein [uncultured Dubosiella sp.]